MNMGLNNARYRPATMQQGNGMKNKHESKECP
jgi:hypothetical protein